MVSLRVLLIRKEFKHKIDNLVNDLGLRVLLIRKEFKRVSECISPCGGLRVLLIRKEFKPSSRSASSITSFESLVNTEGIQTCLDAIAGTICLRVLLIRKEFKQNECSQKTRKSLRVLLIRKEFKRQHTDNPGGVSLRVLLIRKEFKPLIKVCIYFLCECHSTRVSHNLFDNRLINTSSRQHRYTCMSAAMWCTINIKLFHKWLEIAIIVVSVLKMLSVFCVK